MGDGRRPAGREALDEMGRQVAARLATLGDPPPDEPPSPPRSAVTERALDAPSLPAGLDDLLAIADGWPEWRQRLAEWTRRARYCVPNPSGLPPGEAEASDPGGKTAR